MGSAPLHITRISENLRRIQNEITLLAGAEVDDLDERLGEPDVRALRKVKLSVDHLRQVLRTYIDFANAQVQDSEEIQVARVERTTQILRYACEGLQLRERLNREVPASLFEQLTVLAFAAVDRHMASPVEEELALAAD
ncbi:MAG TPA: hypothetical protein VGL89_14395 [Candidatus Koribacter sp.]|jgi:hypothetical protein